MKLSKLIERLEELRDELQFLHGDAFDPEVVVGPRPTRDVVGAAVHEKVVWIAVNGPPATGSPYAPREAWDTDED